MQRGHLSSGTFEVHDVRGRRLLRPSDLPLPLGDADSAGIELPGTLGTVAWLAMAEGDLFLQPEEGHELGHDGSRSRRSHWLRSGDVVGLGSARLRVESSSTGLILRVERAEEKQASVSGAAAPTPPKLRPPAATSAPSRGDSPAMAVGKGPEPFETIRPMEFRPAREADPHHRRSSSWRSPVGIVAAFLLLGLAAVAFFLFTARSIKVEVKPAPDRQKVVGGFLVPLGQRILVRPGHYVLEAEKEGYRPLSLPIEVGEAASQEFFAELERLPDRVRFVAQSQASSAPQSATAPIDGATIRVDGREVGSTPLEDLELAPGSYRVEITADRYRPWATDIEIEGGGREHEVRAELQPLWSLATILSEPPGAQIRVQGRAMGTTPLEISLDEGTHRFELVKAGFEPLRSKVEVVAGQPATVGPLRLRPADGNLVLTSEPSGANIRIDGTFRGRTPANLELAPDRQHRLHFSLPGHGSIERTVRVASGAAEQISVSLEPILGEVRIAAFPPAAELWVNGESRGQADGKTLDLPTEQEYEIEVRLEGYLPQRRQLTPLPGVLQRIEMKLETQAAAREAAIVPVAESAEGHRLILIEPGRLQMGASRREAGRRANETQREVELTSRFYLGAQEISNAQFRRFRSGHDSGTSGGQSLDLDDRPVVRVSWQDAVRYCNWLSAKEGLPPAYREEGDSLILTSPAATGYRLPTEAEWAWAARYSPAGGSSGASSRPRKYPWGNSLPVGEGSGNFADASADGVLSGVLEGYRDGYPATAPVDAFGPDARGLYQLGGNVAEWVHDVYELRPSGAGARERDPMGPKTGNLYVIRGSSWRHSSVTELRWSFRDYGNEPRPDVGFRIARRLGSPPAAASPGAP